MRLDGKVILITGASEGIGAACAAVLRKRGAKLALVARSEEKLRASASSGDLVLPTDLSDPLARAGLVDKVVSHFGQIDVLINNAGAGLYVPSHKTPMEQARALWELNFFAALDLCQQAAGPMKVQTSGAIVNVGSIAGKVTLPWFTLYSASKYAIGSLTEGLRMELESYGIQCLTICPGYIKTDFQKNVLGGRPPELAGLARSWAITPEQCAEAIIRGIEGGKRTVVTPASGWFFILAARLFPRAMDKRLAAVYRQQAGEQ